MKKIKPTIGTHIILPIILETILLPTISLGGTLLLIQYVSDLTMLEMIHKLLTHTEGQFMVASIFIAAFLLSLCYTLSIEMDHYKEKKHNYHYHQITWKEYMKDNRYDKDFTK